MCRKNSQAAATSVGLGREIGLLLLGLLVEVSRRGNLRPLALSALRLPALLGTCLMPRILHVLLVNIDLGAVDFAPVDL